jgi:methyl-accepting chemotaxis protein
MAFSVRTKITAATGGLVAILLAVTTYNMADDLRDLKAARRVQVQVAMCTLAGEVQYGLQGERGASINYLVNPDVTHQDALTQARKECDEQLVKWDNFFLNGGPGSNLKASDPDLSDQLDKLLDLRTNLQDERNDINNKKPKFYEVETWYEQLITGHIALVPCVARTTSEGAIGSRMAALGSLLQTMERSGEERSVITAVLAADRFEPGMRNAYLKIVAEEDAYNNNFTAMADPKLRQYARTTVTGPECDEVTRMRGVLLENATGSGFGLDPKAWFDDCTKKRILLKQVESEATGTLDTEAAALTRHQELTVMIGTASTVVAMLAGILALVLGHTISRRARALAEWARRLGAGDLGGDRPAPGARDELGEMNLVLGRLADDLAAHLRRNRETVGGLAATTAQILASTQEQAGSTQEQAAAVQETSTTMEELRQTGQQIAERSRQVATAAESTSVAGAAGQQAVQETLKTMEGIREQVESVAETIVALSEKTQAVGDIIATVTDIAERANLLALNAGIEAAGAGEQGARFSVVASELKGLADQAKESTVQVRGILSDIQKGINSAVMLTEEAVKRVESGKAQADSSNAAIRQFASVTEGSVQAFQQIVAATNQQFIGFDQVTQTLREMSQSSRQTASAIGQLEQAARGLDALGQRLAQLEGRFHA